MSGFTIYCIYASEMGLGKSQTFWDKISRTRIWTKICKDMQEEPINSCAKGFHHISNGFRATASQSPFLDLVHFSSVRLWQNVSQWVKVDWQCQAQCQPVGKSGLDKIFTQKQPWLIWKSWEGDSQSRYPEVWWRPGSRVTDRQNPSIPELLQHILRKIWPTRIGTKFCRDNLDGLFKWCVKFENPSSNGFRATVAQSQFGLSTISLVSDSGSMSASW